jgi:protein TonB
MHAAPPFILQQEKPRMGPAAMVSLTTHLVIFAGLMLLRSIPGGVPIAGLSARLSRGVVFLSDPGAGGGGGGGGTRMKEPPRAAVMPGNDALTVPAPKTKSIEASASPGDVTPPPQLDVQLQPLASGLQVLPGLSAVPAGASTASQGSGTRGGAGSGDGLGSGPGKGDGIGEGFDRNFGGSVPAAGNGVTTPVLLFEVKPQYTADAMRAKAQGSVLVECIVNADGMVGDARVRRSLDRVFGLDQEALKAAKQWLFRPGTYQGQAVPVRITIELTFTVR